MINFLNKKTKIYTIFILLFLSLLIYLSYYFYKNLFNKNFIELVSFYSDLITIVAILGVFFAIWQYFINKNQIKKQVFLTLKSQLEVIGSWASYDNDGYLQLDAENTRKRNARYWCNPFHVIFSTETTAIESIWSLPGITLLPDIIIKKIAPLNQEIENFNSYLESIKAFASSIPYNEAIIIENKLNQRLDPFSNCIEFNQQEKDICKKLSDMYIYLHYKLIGDEATNTLHKKHKDLLDLVKEYLD